MEVSTAERVEEALLLNEVAREDSMVGTIIHTIPDLASVEAHQKSEEEERVARNAPNPACRPFSDIRVGTRRQAYNSKRASDQPNTPRELTSSELRLCDRCREESASLGSSRRQSSGP